MYTQAAHTAAMGHGKQAFTMGAAERAGNGCEGLRTSGGAPLPLTDEGLRRLCRVHPHQLLHHIHKLVGRQEEQRVVALHSRGQLEPAGGTAGVCAVDEAAAGQPCRSAVPTQGQAGVPAGCARPWQPGSAGPEPAHLPAYSICLYSLASWSVL